MVKKLALALAVSLSFASACLAASQNGSTIPSATQIVDPIGALWLVQGGGVTCTRNGINPDGCVNVQVLLYYNGNVYAENSTSDHNWYVFANASASWIKVSGDPRSQASTTPAPTPAPVPDVTSFTPVSNSTDAVRISNNHPFTPRNANKAWSVTNPDSQTVRFQLQSGEYWAEDLAAHPTNTPERSMLDASGTQYSSGTPIEVSFNWTPGTSSGGSTVPSTAYFFDIMQFHNNDGVFGSPNPPFEIDLCAASGCVTGGGDYMNIDIGWLTANPAPIQTLQTGTSKTGVSVSYGYVYCDKNPIVRGHTYTMVIKIMFHPKHGYAYVWRDGIQVVNYAGPLGFGDPAICTTCTTYWGMGLYRGPTSNDTQIATFSNFTITP
jgi:hypothetical protein